MLWPLQLAENIEFYKRYIESDEQVMEDIAEAFAREEGEPTLDLAQFPEILMDHVAVPGTFFGAIRDGLVINTCNDSGPIDDGAKPR
jgi:hypothetical protein